ncbi:histidine kinase [Sorangium cellulosum]|uniref:histidine kinase n=1 Tax=Sorangium cellulosum TaxID=56 RepID=A0A4P2PUH7_SORCE|nr:ATP-binding protein [Sorangium cellulosum]AUX20043.1 histidine kinase [Sorangium cellulosum]
MAYAFGIELPYSLLVPVAHLRLLGVVDSAVQARMLGLIGLMYLVKTAGLVALLVHMLRPIERLRRYAVGHPVPGGAGPGEAESGGPAPPESLILAAANAAYDTPLAFATVWAVSWALLYLPVTAALYVIEPSHAPLGVQRVVALVLFAVALFAAALPLAYSILGRLLSPAAGVISLIARERGLAVPGKGYSLAVRLVILGACLAIAPTSWMAAMVLGETAGPAKPGLLLTLAIFSVVAVTWAPVCAGFLAGALAGPFQQVAAVIQKIVQRGEVDRLERIPVYFKDEIGALAGGVNAMVDRLEESSRRRRSYLAERERLLQDAAQRAAQLGAVLDNLVEGVFACDREGRLTMLNASGLRLLGLSDRSEQAGRMVEDVMDLGRMRHTDGRPFSRDELPMVRALAGETIVQEEQVLADGRAGRDVFLRTSAAPIRSEGGAILGAVTVARDVTELMELDLVKDQFIRVGAHELKTPVAIMKGYALALLRNTQDIPEQRRRMLEAIDRGADRINRIVDDLLAISQVTLDVLQVSEEDVDLAELLSETVERAAKSASRHRVRLSLEVERPPVVRADPERLRQVLASLLDNAVKYSPEGGDIDVRIAVAERAPASSPPRCDAALFSQRHGAPPRFEAVVSVRDQGVGIPAHKQERIFERFFRAHTDTRHDYGGMGIGLFLAKDMVARHGGRMWFESEEDKGSTFYFTIPLSDEAPVVDYER